MGRIVSQGPGLCKYAVPDVPVERLFGYDVNLDSEEILQVFLEFDVVEKVSAPVPGHEEIQIAARIVVTALLTASDRPEDAEIVRSVACGQAKIALRLLVRRSCSVSIGMLPV